MILEKRYVHTKTKEIRNRFIGLCSTPPLVSAPMDVPELCRGGFWRGNLLARFQAVRAGSLLHSDCEQQLAILPGLARLYLADKLALRSALAEYIWELGVLEILDLFPSSGNTGADH